VEKIIYFWRTTARMVIIKKNDFIMIDFIAKSKSDNKAFDVTSVAEAKQVGLFAEGQQYGSRIICVGQGHIIKGVDDAFVGCEPGKSYEMEVKAENAFGKKDANMVKVVSAAILKKQGINPFPGLQLNATGMFALVRSVNGGRVLLDYNHPLAGKDVVYLVKIHEIIHDNEKKLSALVDNILHAPSGELTVRCEGTKCALQSKQKIPQEVQELFLKQVQACIPGLECTFA